MATPGDGMSAWRAPPHPAGGAPPAAATRQFDKPANPAG
ncbi:hypothetical protein AX27061_3116 [Achromobacter xylosoxidans NBRC 15126 = ATCC 27061]|nr:hypothetical protein AX27061_3116 [Achromobacter xylosoxidans NBRC 15126 = ATCC 27061]